MGLQTGTFWRTGAEQKKTFLSIFVKQKMMTVNRAQVFEAS